jgi:hypothetical protein
MPELRNLAEHSAGLLATAVLSIPLWLHLLLLRQPIIFQLLGHHEHQKLK